MDFTKDPNTENGYMLRLDDDSEFEELTDLGKGTFTLGRFILSNKLRTVGRPINYPESIPVSEYEAIFVARLMAKPLMSKPDLFRIAHIENPTAHRMALTANNFLTRKDSGAI